MNVRPSLAEVLDLCMARVRDGETVEACVADYPEYEEELRDELEAAALFSQAFVFPIDQDRKRAARLRMHAAFDRKASGWRGFRLPFGSGLFVAGTRLAAVAAAVALVLVFSGTGTVLASQSSVPGDVLYPVKRTSENVRLALALTDDRESDLREQFTRRRIEELEAIATEDKQRFVAGLVSDIIEQTNRKQELATTPVEQALNGRTNGQPTSIPTSAPGTVDPVPTPASPTATSSGGGDVAVSIAPVLDLREDVAKLKQRLSMLEDKVNTVETKAELERLRRAINANQAQIDRLLNRVDNLRGDTSVGNDRPDDKPIDQDDHTAPVATPTPTPTLAPNVITNGRRTARVLDVRFVETDGVAKVEIKALADDGTPLHIEIMRGGALLLKDGEQAGLRDLAVGQTVVLSIERDTGKVLAVSIVPMPASDQIDIRNTTDGRDAINRREGNVPPATVPPATSTRDSEGVKEAERRAAEEQANDEPTSTPTPQPNEDVSLNPPPASDSNTGPAPTPTPTAQADRVPPPSPTPTATAQGDQVIEPTPTPTPELNASEDGGSGDADWTLEDTEGTPEDADASPEPTVETRAD